MGSRNPSEAGDSHAEAAGCRYGAGTERCQFCCIERRHLYKGVPNFLIKTQNKCLLLRKMNFHMVEDMYILYSTILFVESVVLCRYRDITGTGI